MKLSGVTAILWLDFVRVNYSHAMDRGKFSFGVMNPQFGKLNIYVFVLGNNVS